MQAPSVNWQSPLIKDYLADHALLSAEKTAVKPWFPSHPSRDIYITLLSSPSPVPDSLLKSALLVRATADVKRIWRLRDDKAALNSLHQRGLIGDDTMTRFGAAEKELEAEIVDVVQEANTFPTRMGRDDLPDGDGDGSCGED